MSFTITASYTTFSCWHCGGSTGIEAGALKQRQDDGRHVHCALCGSKNWWCEKSLEKQLAAERAAHDQTKADRDWQRTYRQQAEKSLSVRKGIITRIKNRVGRGVCPCCNRYFDKLHQHMQTKHPGYRHSEA